MRRDRYDNPLSTQSDAARDAYVEGVDLFLAAQSGAEQAFHRALEADPDLAVAHAGLARVLQLHAKGPDAAAAIARARDRVSGSSEREASHVAAIGHLIDGNGPAGLQAIRHHILDHPRDAMVVQPCTGVFGLIGFSGQPGREAEQLAFMAPLVRYYGEDWWFDSVLAFAEVEAGQTAKAEATIERSLAANPDSANGAHIRAHVHYEAGETEAGLAYIDDWRSRYDKAGPLHCHISWHVALWAMESGRMDKAWSVIETDVKPGGGWGPPINVLTDTAAFLFRAELAGEAPRPDLWHAVADFAAKTFPNPGIAFADAHAALAHAMAGNGALLERLVREPAGPAGPVVASLAAAFGAFAKGEWDACVAGLAPVMASHERIGGSRAQRDLVEFALVAALLRSGRVEEARRTLEERRPAKAASAPLAGLGRAA